MGFRDRFFTPTTAKAILSWRILVGVAVGVVAGLIGLHPLPATLSSGSPPTSSLVLAGDATIGDPRRDRPVHVERAVAAAIARRPAAPAAVPATPSARCPPVRCATSSTTSTSSSEHALGEAWQIAKRRRRDRRRRPPARPDHLAVETGNRSAARHATSPHPNTSRRSRRCRDSSTPPNDSGPQSDETAATLRLTQTQLDELVARAGEVTDRRRPTPIPTPRTSTISCSKLEALRHGGQRRPRSVTELAAAIEPRRRHRHGALPPVGTAAACPCSPT